MISLVPRTTLVLLVFWPEWFSLTPLMQVWSEFTQILLVPGVTMAKREECKAVSKIISSVANARSIFKSKQPKLQLQCAGNSSFHISHAIKWIQWPQLVFYGNNRKKPWKGSLHRPFQYCQIVAKYSTTSCKTSLSNKNERSWDMKTA